ncbi:MAG: protease, partial [Proteobacteria bacterium]|nr:protease [Pseudomonadota bacterium]
TGNAVEIDGNLFTGTDPNAMPELLHRIIEHAKSGG